MSADPDSNSPAPESPVKDAASGDARSEEWDRFRSNTKTILGAVVLAIIIRIALFEAFEIDGPSMEPTLLHEDRVVVAKCLYGLFLPRMHESVANWGMPNLGDVIIINSPADDVDIVKRVVGLPGDVVEVRDSVVFRNGEAVPTRRVGACDEGQQKDFDPSCFRFEERVGDHVYRTSRSQYAEHDEWSPVIVPPGHVFVLGDHRDHSNDSRNLGPISVRRVKGRALFIYLSGSVLRGEVRWNRIGRALD